mmetsp:Transcript_3263/g.5054  ORF Transcript_3263/g.5054 Transcript_3263/m.5054 type:complete len:219 (+) Transcript_3263:43-699(+)
MWVSVYGHLHKSVCLLVWLIMGIDGVSRQPLRIHVKPDSSQTFLKMDEQGPDAMDSVRKIAEVRNTGPETAPAVPDNNIEGEMLTPCGTSHPTQLVTGFQRKGYCFWNQNDEGFHQVCVKMSEKLLDKLGDEKMIENVKAGDEWCICAWTLAFALHEDAEDALDLEVQCSASNYDLLRLLRVREHLSAPSGQDYPTAPVYNYLQGKCDLAHYNLTSAT